MNGSCDIIVKTLELKVKVYTSNPHILMTDSNPMWCSRGVQYYENCATVQILLALKVCDLCLP